MIVLSMSVREIHKEVFEDIKNLQNKLDECRGDFKKTVLTSSRISYPYIPQIFSRDTGNVL